MYCNEFKPEYVECLEKAWSEVRPGSLIPKELPAVADLVIIEYNRVSTFVDIIISNQQTVYLYFFFLAFK